MPALLPLQLAIGLLQGILLHLILDIHAGVAARPALNALIAIFVFVPPAINISMPALPGRRAAIWAAAMCVVVGGIACYRSWVFEAKAPLLLPETSLLLLTSFSQISFYWLFIGQALLLASTRDRAFIASYPSYFDVAWSQATQIILGAIFTLFLYGIVWLGAELFSIIGLQGLKTFIQHRWVYLPLITTGFTLSTVVTGQRVQLLRTSRTLFLTLAAWLLPFLSLLVLAFLLALPVTGVAPLWATHRAGAVLILTAFFLVLLINTVYGDGADTLSPSRILRGFASLSALLLLPLVALAAYGAARRIGEHGWTQARIFLIADICIIAIYAFLYPAALFRRARGWMHGLRTANLAAAFVILGLILLLWSPVLDPTRIAVANQMARLHDGRVKAADFDYAFLRFSAGRYGAAALQRLRTGWTGPDAVIVAAKADAMSRQNFRGVAETAILPQKDLAEARRDAIKVYPAGAQLPSDLLSAVFDTGDRAIPNCLTREGARCEAVLVDILHQGRPQVLFITGFPLALMSQPAPGGPWQAIARLQGNLWCPKVTEALKRGDITVVPHPFSDVQAAGVTLTLIGQPDRLCP